MNKKMLFVFNPKAGKGKIKTNLLEFQILWTLKMSQDSKTTY